MASSPGAELAPLDPGSYKLRLPGNDKWVRVTTSADVFDDHLDGHEFLSPGGCLFESLAEMTGVDASENGSAAGHCWLVQSPDDGKASEVLVLTQSGPERVRSLGELINDLDQLPPRGCPGAR